MQDHSQNSSQDNNQPSDAKGRAASEKFRLASVSVLASLAIAVGKFLVALLTGSLAALSEALHGLIDLGSVTLTLLVVKWADRPADEDHHFGHAKAESLAALFAALLLIVIAAFAAYQAVRRLLGDESAVHVPPWVILFFVIAIGVDYWRATALQKGANAHGSHALAADAAHFTSDMAGTFAALLGLVGVWLGFTWTDSVAALVVAAIVLWIAYGLIKTSLPVLLDEAPHGATEKISAALADTPGLLQVKRLLARTVGNKAYVVISADASRALPASAQEQLRKSIIARVQSVLPDADVSVDLAAVALSNETVRDKVQAIAAEYALPVHHVIVQDLGRKLAVSFDVEVEGGISLEQAHAQVTKLESSIRQSLGGDVEVEAHLEPRPEILALGTEVSASLRDKVLRQLHFCAKAEKALSDIHSLRVRRVSDGLIVHYHCRFSEKTTVQNVHDAIDRVEARLMTKLPEIKRIVAHAEPVGHGRHQL